MMSANLVCDGKCLRPELETEIERLRKGWKKEADADCRWALKEIERLRALANKAIDEIDELGFPGKADKFRSALERKQ